MFTLNEISEYTGLSMSTLRTYRRDRRLPAEDHTHKGRPYWKKERIEEWWKVRTRRKQQFFFQGRYEAPAQHSAPYYTSKTGRPADQAGTYDLYDYKGDPLLSRNKALRVPKAQLNVQVKRGLYLAFKRKCQAEKISMAAKVGELLEDYVFGSR